MTTARGLCGENQLTTEMSEIEAPSSGETVAKIKQFESNI